MALRRDFFPNSANDTVRSDPVGDPHNSEKGFPKKRLHPAGPECFDHIEIRVRQQGELDLVSGLELRLRVNRIAATPDHRGVRRLELFERATEFNGFVRAARGVGFRIKIEDKILPLVIRRGNRRTIVGRGAKLRRGVACFQHGVSISSRSYSASTLLRTSFTACGFAWPRVSRITWPTKNLNRPSFPERYLLTFS